MCYCLFNVNSNSWLAFAHALMGAPCGTLYHLFNGFTDHIQIIQQ